MKYWRLTWSIVCFLIALLAVFPAPAKCFWYVALGATEWSYWLVWVSWVPLGVHGQTSPRVRCLSLGAGLLFLTPLIRAWPLARRLPGECQAQFGQVQPREAAGASARSSPLSLVDL